MLFFIAKKPVNEEQESAKQTAIDRATQSWFTCTVDNEEWDPIDSLYAATFVKSDELVLSLDCRDHSVTFTMLSLTIPCGRASQNVNRQLSALANDTLLALITYSFAAIDYLSGTPMPVNHMAFELKPTALVCFTDVDTIKQTLGGSFKAVAENEGKRKHTFKNGAFGNVPIR